ncbi:MAG TPA: hypothetical protein PLT57_08120, partial [Accumulibacter sp.]|nr:hypothetical protein [Accumulibacter sp.]
AREREASLSSSPNQNMANSKQKTGQKSKRYFISKVLRLLSLLKVRLSNLPTKLIILMLSKTLNNMGFL